VDVFDDRQIMLAFVNRAQIDRDMLLVAGLPDTAIDPVAVHLGDGYVTTKAGFDLTLPPSPLPGFPKQFEQTIGFPAELEKRLSIEDYLGQEALRKLEREDQ
jgi:3-polyprenyl-4-hydroxybenzoate decarboxylase